MAISTREMVITYGSYSCGGSSVSRIHDYTGIFQGTEQTGVRFSILITGTSIAAFATACVALETAFRTPYKDLDVSIGGSSFLALSHSGGTGFNAKPTIEKPGGLGDSALSRLYTVRIDFGMPADTYATEDRRESTVRVTFAPDTRRHVAIDGVYTCNGSTAARAQYLAAIGTYASSILTALGGSYDLLEHHVENDDQNKVATFHRLYDEQIVDRNEATIAVFYSSDRRRHVTISGKYTKVLAGSGARATYNADIGGFVTTVLGAIGGTYDLQEEHADANDTDTVLTFSGTYDELIGGRKEASYQIEYDGSRIRTVTFQGTYTTVTAATSALSAAATNGPIWASSILTAIGVANSDKVSEKIIPNDQDNAASFMLVYRELIYSEAGALPDAQIVNQKFNVRRAKEAPGDSPTAVRVVTLELDYSAQIVWTLNTNLQTKWNAIRQWLVTTIAPTFQAGFTAVVSEKVDFDPVSNQLSANVVLEIATNNILLNKLEIVDEVDQGIEYVGLWTDNPLDFFDFDGHIVAVRSINKTYRILRNSAAPNAGGVSYSGPKPTGGRGAGSVLNPIAPGISGSSGEAGDDPFGFGNFRARVTKRAQSYVDLDIGLPPNVMPVRDVTYSTTVRITNRPVVSTQ